MTKRIAFKSPPPTAEQWIGGGRATEPMKRFTIDVPVSLHTRIKVACANRGVQMADVIRHLLEREFPKQ